jgi:hypothetical protein
MRVQKLKSMTHKFTLPRLQSMLDRLPDGQKLALARKQVDELFGLNGVRSARLARFASGHACIIVHDDSSVVFEKRKAARA